jgi:hypothetical protein
VQSRVARACEDDAFRGSRLTSSLHARVRARLLDSPHRCVSSRADQRSVEFRIPRDQSSGYINNKRELYDFKMNHIFGADATQADIFDGIGKKVVNNVLEGFNGTREAPAMINAMREGEGVECCTVR